MKDNEIISLFEIRDEHAIKALSDKYPPYCYKIAWRGKELVKVERFFPSSKNAVNAER